MFKVNDNYLKLPGSYLFSTIGKKVAAYKEANPDKEVISLGIGDVTQPLAPAVIDALHSAVDEMSKAETFHGYAPDLGYEFLRRAIADNDYKSRGVDIALDEIFVSDGAKSDSGNIVDIFSQDNVIAVTDPVYPVYVDSNAMSGKTGEYLKDKECWSNVIYMPCTAENNFVPELPEKTPDIIYICCPNNPTGTTLTKEQLQMWVDYANEKKAVIIYDAAYEAYISETDVPHSIYECDGAKTCAIEMRSFSKMPDLPEPVLDLQLCQNSLLTAMERCLTAFGQDAMEQNSMVRHTSFSVPVKQCTAKQAKHRQKSRLLII